MSKALKLLNEISTDQLSGASVLAGKAAECILAFVDERKEVPVERLFESVGELGRRLVAAQPGMAPIFNLVNSLLLRLEELRDHKPRPREFLSVVRGNVNGFIRDSKVAVREIAGTAGGLIYDGFTVFTHSYSSSVFAGLKQAKAAGRRYCVITTESRPLFEGRNLATALVALGLPVTLVADAAATSFIAESSLVLVGADMVTESFIVNKVGTYPIALIAKRFKIPIYSVSELSKCMPARLVKGFRVERPPKQIWQKSPKKIDVKNVCFEAVPLGLFDGVVTEQGVMSTKDTRECVKEQLASRGIAQKLLQGASRSSK